MSAKLAYCCAGLLAASLALYAWLRPRPADAPLERAAVHARSPRFAAVPPKPSFAMEPSPAPETESTREQPHSVTPARAALAAQSSLFLEIERALDAGDVARMKQLLKQHEREFVDLDEGAEARKGYEAIAHCIENPGTESRAFGERFVAAHRASPLRRKVRHACLGARKPALLPPT